jgi:hypothetical protein
MNGYVAFWKNNRIDRVYADTAYGAQQKAAERFAIGKRVGVVKRWDVTVVLAEQNGKQVTHVADF